MTFLDIENASRDELVALAKAQHETIASMAKQQSVNDQLVEALECITRIEDDYSDRGHGSAKKTMREIASTALAAAKEGA